MYNPKHFQSHDSARLVELMKRYPFATVVTVCDGAPVINHLPVMIEGEGSELRIIGHMARRNALWQDFGSGKEVTLIFHGPHTLINPSWYPQEDVPTWNYAVVHARGRPRLIDDQQGMLAILEKTTRSMVDYSKETWDFYIPDDLSSESDLCAAIVGFAIEDLTLEGKFKLSQNRTMADREAVLKGLLQRGDEQSLAIRELMKAN